MKSLRMRLSRLENASVSADEIAEAIDRHDRTGGWSGRPAIVCEARVLKELIRAMHRSVTGDDPRGPTLAVSDVELGRPGPET